MQGVNIVYSLCVDKRVGAIVLRSVRKGQVENPAVSETGRFDFERK